ncbi:hypothetical protein BGZ65_007943 [Modicella reniformis]|uniref:Uncharacterized protein n=1 Tax=Modicella reniformis TaxID=1440133 RepID=A0A9P6IL62_9FUNG|nr:hypothetical protein BGZ65_007943 [Modicella reniformis]
MGTLINFISQHIHLPLSPSSARERANDYFGHQQPCDKPRYYSIHSDLSSSSNNQREHALQRFPCEDKHSFNPHYQHNLISTSPPSLSSSLSTSSPSSAHSNGSSSFSRATGARAFGQESHGYKPNHDYSYNRRHIRRQNLRCYTFQQQQEQYHDDWMFGIADDDYHGITDDDYHGINTGNEAAVPSMTRACPQDSPISPTCSSLKSSLSRKGKSQRGSLMNVFATTSRSTVTFSPVVVEHEAQLPESDNTSAVVVVSAVSTCSSSAEVESGAGCQTAKPSLLRISQCSKSEDGWCTQIAGQHAKRYAEATSRAMMVEGRRARRL